MLWSCLPRRRDRDAVRAHRARDRGPAGRDHRGRARRRVPETCGSTTACSCPRAWPSSAPPASCTARTASSTDRACGAWCGSGCSAAWPPSRARSSSSRLPLVLGVLVLTARGIPWPRRFQWVIVGGVVSALVIAPWVGYNLSRFDKPVYLSAQLGGTVVAANCPSTYYGQYLGFKDYACQGAAAKQATKANPNFSRESAADKDTEFGKIGNQYVKDHLSRLPIVVAAPLGADPRHLPPGPGGQRGASGFRARTLGRLPVDAQLLRRGRALGRGDRGDQAPARAPLAPARAPGDRVRVRRADVRADALPRAGGSVTRAARGRSASTCCSAGTGASHPRTRRRMRRPSMHPKARWSPRSFPRRRGPSARSTPRSRPGSSSRASRGCWRRARTRSSAR